MGLNDLLNELLEKKQRACNHPYQDRCDISTTTTKNIFCGNCGMRLEK